MALRAVLGILQAVSLQLRRDHAPAVTPIHALLLMAVHRQDVDEGDRVFRVGKQGALEIPAPGHPGVVWVTPRVALDLVAVGAGSILEVDLEGRKSGAGILR